MHFKTASDQRCILYQTNAISQEEKTCRYFLVRAFRGSGLIERECEWISLEGCVWCRTCVWGVNFFCVASLVLCSDHVNKARTPGPRSFTDLTTSLTSGQIRLDPLNHNKTIIRGNFQKVRVMHLAGAAEFIR